MPLPTKPTNNSDFATDGAAPKTRPPATLRTDGYAQDDIPTHQNFNWIFNNFYLWEAFFEAFFDFLTTNHFVFDEAGDTITIGNSSTDYSLVRYLNDEGNIMIRSRDRAVTNTAINQIDFNRNKTMQKVYAFTSPTDMDDNGSRSAIMEWLALKDGYAFACALRKEINDAQGYSQANKDTINGWLNSVVTGSLSISNYNDNIDLGVPSIYPQSTADLLYLTDTDDQSYFGNTISLNALKISSDRSGGSGTPGLYEYADDAFIGVNASYSGSNVNPFVQDRKCQGLSSDGGRMCGFQFLPGGTGVRVVTQQTAQVHATVLTAGTNYTNGPYVSMNGTTWTDASDARLKDIVSDVDDEALDLIQKIDCKIAIYKSDEDRKEVPVYIAQNIQEYLPNIVVEDDQGMLGVGYNHMITVNTAGIKSLIKENRELKECISNMEERLLKLENG